MQDQERRTSSLFRKRLNAYNAVGENLTKCCMCDRSTGERCIGEASVLQLCTHKVGMGEVNFLKVAMPDVGAPKAGGHMATNLADLFGSVEMLARRSW